MINVSNLRVPLGTVFTETKNSTGYGITPIETENSELPYQKCRNGKIPEQLKNNTVNTNFKMTESKYTKTTQINYTSYVSIDNPTFYFRSLKLLVLFF